MKILLVTKWIDGGIKGDFHHSGEWADTFELACALRDRDASVVIISPKAHKNHTKRFEEEFGKTLKKKKIIHSFVNASVPLGKLEGSFQMRTHWSIIKALYSFRPDVIQFMQLVPTFVFFLTNKPVFFYGIVMPSSYPNEQLDTQSKLKWLSPRNISPRSIFESILYAGLFKFGLTTDIKNLPNKGVVVLKHKNGFTKMKSLTISKYYQNIKYLHKGIALPKRNSLKRKNKKIVFFMGSIMYRKGIFDLVEAFSRVNQVYPQASLLIAGTGPNNLVKRLKSEIKKNNISATLLSSINKEQGTKIFQESSVFCLPSYSDVSPAAIMEAMSAGMPVITTFEAESLIINNKNGILVKAGDIKGISSSILKVFSDRKLADRLGKSAFKTISRYGWESRAGKLIKLYEEHTL